MRENEQACCPHCGKPLLFDDTVCPYCGQSVGLGPKRYVTVGQKAREQRAILHRGHHRVEQKQTWVPRNSTGVWTGPEQHSTGKKPRKVSLKRTVVIAVAAVALTQLLPVLPVVVRLVSDLVPREQQEETIVYDYTKPALIALRDDRDPPDREGPLPAYGEEDYYQISEEEFQALTPDALWNHPERWTEMYPELTEQDREFMEEAAFQVEFLHDSRAVILKNLQEKEYEKETAEKALDRLQVDWNTQALRSMLCYLESSPFSPQGLWDQLFYEKFTQEEIQYAFDHCGVDWYHQLEMLVSQEFRYDNMSETEVWELIISGGFSGEDCEKFMETLQVDWKEQALQAAADYIDMFESDEEETERDLETKKFTPEQIQYALESLYD